MSPEEIAVIIEARRAALEADLRALTGLDIQVNAIVHTDEPAARAVAHAALAQPRARVRRSARSGHFHVPRHFWVQYGGQQYDTGDTTLHLSARVPA